MTATAATATHQEATAIKDPEGLMCIFRDKAHEAQTSKELLAAMDSAQMALKEYQKHVGEALPVGSWQGFLSNPTRTITDAFNSKQTVPSGMVPEKYFDLLTKPDCTKAVSLLLSQYSSPVFLMYDGSDVTLTEKAFKLITRKNVYVTAQQYENYQLAQQFAEICNRLQTINYNAFTMMLNSAQQTLVTVNYHTKQYEVDIDKFKAFWI